LVDGKARSEDVRVGHCAVLARQCAGFAEMTGGGRFMASVPGERAVHAFGFIPLTILCLG